MDFDGSLYWQRRTPLSRANFEARLSAFELRKEGGQLRLLLNRLVRWCDVLDAVTDIRVAGMHSVLMRSGPPLLARGGLPLEPDGFQPTRRDPDLVLVDANFEGLGELTEASHREWCLSPRRPLIVE